MPRAAWPSPRRARSSAPALARPARPSSCSSSAAAFFRGSTAKLMSTERQGGRLPPQRSGRAPPLCAAARPPHAPHLPAAPPPAAAALLRHAVKRCCPHRRPPKQAADKKPTATAPANERKALRRVFNRDALKGFCPTTAKSLKDEASKELTVLVRGREGGGVQCRPSPTALEEGWPARGAGGCARCSARRAAASRRALPAHPQPHPNGTLQASHPLASHVAASTLRYVHVSAATSAAVMRVAFGGVACVGPCA